jgi:heptosyltransferase II
MPSPPRPLIVRLRNWVGDVTLGVPTLQRLADSGYDLRLIGKGWAADLLAGHGWPVEALAKTFGERVRQLRRLRRDALAADPGFGRRLNAVCFPYSFGSALEMRLAGLKAIGHAYEGRSLLLGRSVARPQRMHELEIYWDLGNALFGNHAPPPARIGLRLAPQHLAQAAALRQQHAIRPGYIVICPFAGGTWAGQDKTWPDFAAFVAGELAALGRDIIVCPGPGEESMAREHFATATLLPGVGLGAYAALLQQSALMISNDTGPGHIAAAVGAPLLSVLGPSDPALWRAWGPGVHLLKGESGWPTCAQAAAAAAALLASPR